jgi:hypothetical protein
MGLHNRSPDCHLSDVSARHYRFNQCEFTKSPMTISLDTHRTCQMN